MGTSGIYRLLSSCTNTPNSGSSQGSHIIHTNWDTNAAHQLYFEYYGSMFYRYKHGGEWSDWKRVWTQFEFNPDNYLPLTGGKTITGDFQFKDGVAVRDDDSKNIIGLLNIAGDGVCVAVGNGIKKTRIVTPDDTPVYRNDGKGSYKIYDSGNLGNATTSQAGLMSAADKTKLDGLSGGGLNIPASGEVAVSGWTYNGKQVYAQRWAGDTSTGAVVSGRTTSKTLASVNMSQLTMQGGAFYLSGDITNTFTVLGSQRWADSGAPIMNSRLDFNVEDGTVTLKIYSTTSGVFVYDIWAAYTR